MMDNFFLICKVKLDSEVQIFIIILFIALKIQKQLLCANSPTLHQCAYPKGKSSESFPLEKPHNPASSCHLDLSYFASINI